MNALASPATAHLARLESLLARALSLGCTGAIVEMRGEPVLSISVWSDQRILGHLHLEPATAEREEEWYLTASCPALTGLPMQADWLTEGAKRVREVFTALVQP